MLSGGQKARIQFARVCAPCPHVLVLDEPTNHLDLESIRSLAEAVTKFEGAVVIVSHDEQLLSLACSQLWHCDGEGGVTQLHYGFDEYKQRLRDGRSLLQAKAKGK